MKFNTSRETLLRALTVVTGVVERRQTLPVLANVLVEAGEQGLSLTGTDLEVEMRARLEEGVEVTQPGKTTIDGRKLAAIWAALPEGASVTVEAGSQAIVRSGRSRFSLSTVPPEEFPKVDDQATKVEFSASPENIKQLMEQTSFAMAQQDVRYFLNGMLLEVTEAHLRAVATDGHRLAMCTIEGGVAGVEQMRAIIPRKAVLELNRLIADAESEVRIAIGDSHLRASSEPFTFTTKLIDGKFPDYERVIPRDGKHCMTGDRAAMKQSLTRASILANEKYRGVRLSLSKEQLTVQANNPSQEEAEDAIAVDYDGDELEIGFNVDYLQDVMNVVRGENVRITVSDGSSSARIEVPEEEGSVFVVMPMRL